LDGVKWSWHEEPTLPAWVADMDLAPPDFVVDGLHEFAESMDFGYNFAASDKLIPAFCKWQVDYHGWGPESDQIRQFCDVLHAIDVAIWLNTDPGDGVVLLTPVYHPFITSIISAERRIVDVPLDQNAGWRLDHERLRAAVDAGTKVLLLCHPHNPTGRVFDDEERAVIAEVVVENDLLLISDEVWADLTHPGVTHRPMILEDGLANYTMTVSSASKAFNLAGLRCALAHIGHTGLAKQFDALPPHFLGAVSIPGAVASLASWTKGHQWLAATRRFLTERRDQLTARLAADLPAVGYDPPEATYLAWLDLNSFNLGAEPSKWLLDQAKVALNAGIEFGPNGSGFVRLNFATSADILDEICDRLASALTEADRR